LSRDCLRFGVIAAIFGLVGCATGMPSAPKATAALQRPNIIVVVADDLGAGEVGCYGQRRIRTPNIDALATEGVRLTHFDTASPVCAPSRAALLCGLHSGHAPIRDNREVGAEGQVPIGADTATLVHDLHRAGYATGLFGKWGLGGPGSGSEPLDCGFDAFTGYLCQRKAHDHYPESLWRGRAILPLAGNPTDSDGGATYAHDVIRDDATDFIAAQRDAPFLLVFASPLPHLALQVPQADLAEYVGAFPEIPYDGSMGYRRHPTPRAAYAAMISRFDRDVGALVAAVKAAGIERDTVIVVTADNGATHDVGGVDTGFFDSTAGLRARKGSVFEGGIRVPMVAWAPGRIAPGRVLDEPAWTPDLRATFDGWCGIAAPTTDGRDLSRWLSGREDAPPAAFDGYWEFAGYGGQMAVAFRDGAHLWKAVRTDMGTRGIDTPIMLFDLATDPSEAHDVAAGHPAVLAEARRRWAAGHVADAEFPMQGIEARSNGMPRR
jgi:arylsulfatase